MPSLTSKKFCRKIPVSYSKSPRQLYLETGKACLEQDKTLTYLQVMAGNSSSLDLPTWCSDLSVSFHDRIEPFASYLRAGFRDEMSETSEADIFTFPDEEYIETVGFRADQIEQTLPPRDRFITGPAVDKEVNWHRSCLRLAKSICDKRPGIDAEMAYAYAATANTILRVPDGEALKLAFDDFIQNISSSINGAINEERYWPPKDRLSLFADVNTQVNQTCTGRSFFTTVGGRLGFGAPGVQRGDIVIVIYGAGPVFVLREKAGLGAFEFVGDAFVHELMELDRTAEEAIGPTETFRIIN